MQEGNVQALGTLAGMCVNNAATLLLYLVQGVLYTVFNGKCNVLDTATATILLDELGDSALGGSSLEELNLGLAYLEKGGPYLLVSNFFNGKALEAQHVLVERNGLLERGNGDSHVFDVRNVHNFLVFKQLFNRIKWIFKISHKITKNIFYIMWQSAENNVYLC